MNIFIDTNILYYKYSKASFVTDVFSKNISSINALEFLRNIEKNHNNKAKYYIPRKRSDLANHLMILSSRFKADHPIRKNFADSISFDFKHDFDSYKLYNNESISTAINNQDVEIFKLATSFLSKEEYKDINSKFNFLLDNEINCTKIDIEDIELAYNLLDLFLCKYTLKDDFRNCWNDLLILAKSANEGATLISSDKLLNRFASDILYGNFKEKKDYIEIQFPVKNGIERIDYNQFESKGYINRGWQYKIRNSR